MPCMFNIIFNYKHSGVRLQYRENGLPTLAPPNLPCFLMNSLHDLCSNTRTVLPASGKQSLSQNMNGSCVLMSVTHTVWHKPLESSSKMWPLEYRHYIWYFWVCFSEHLRQCLHIRGPKMFVKKINKCQD